MKQTNSRKSRNEVTLFCITTILLTWLLWVPAFLMQNHGIPMRLSYDFFITVGTFVPSVAGVFFTYIFGGKAEVRSLLKSLLNIRIGAKWLLFILLVLPAISAVSCLVFYLMTSTLPQAQFPAWFIPVAFVYILIFMGPLGEEAGWRGFALKKMLGSISPFKAAVQLGIIWSLWHLPLFFINGTTQNALTSFGSIPAILGYTLYTVMISVLITFIYIVSNGSVFGAILLHTMGNLSLGVVPIIITKTGAVILLIALCIAVTCITYKYKAIMFKNTTHVE